MKLLQIKNHALVTLPEGETALAFGQTTFILPRKLSAQLMKVRGELINGLAPRASIPNGLLKFLEQHNLICAPQSASPNRASEGFSAVEAQAILQAAIEMWKPLPGFHPIFGLLKKSRELAIALLIEQTVFVSAAYSYLGLAAKSCTQPKAKKALRVFAEEERYHYRGLLKDLELSEDDLARHDMAPGTQALLSFLHESAFRNPIAILIISSLFETSPDEVDELTKFYRKLSKQIAMPLDHFLSHHVLDVELGHVSLWHAAFDGRKRIPFEEVSNWIQALHTAKHLIELWYDSIVTESHRKDSLKTVTPVSLIRPKPTAASIYVG